MSKYGNNLREEEIKNRVAHDYFGDYDSVRLLGDIDFCIAVPTDGNELFEQESLLWAESKKGNKFDIYESFVQLILTIGKARTFDKHLPPAFLGAFDAEKIGFLPYYRIADIFYVNDFNWNVTPSNHDTKEFKLLYDRVKNILDNETLVFDYIEHDKDLRLFIKNNFVVGKSELSKIEVNKNNFIFVYNKWEKEVKPTIAIDWEAVKSRGILDADFFLADLLSEHNTTIKENLYVLLLNSEYELDRRYKDGLFDSSKAFFSDKQKAHTRFWNRYVRPPRREFWDYLVQRRDLLVPQDVRERKGSYFTPKMWVEKSQDYLAKVLGENWQEDYYIWDCCAGTGNMEFGLTNKYNVWASTIDQADVDVMKDQIKNTNFQLLENHVFQFDFLNDDFSKLPEGLRDIINDEEKQRKLVIYINPPYAEHGNRSTITSSGKHKSKVAITTKIYEEFSKEVGKSACRELYIQFFLRIKKYLGKGILASFSTLKYINAKDSIRFRNYFLAEFKKGFICKSSTFDNVTGQPFPIGFLIWDLGVHKHIDTINVDIIDGENPIGKKAFYHQTDGTYLSDWFKQYSERTHNELGSLRVQGSDFQQQNNISVSSVPTENDIEQRTFTYINSNNIFPVAVYFSVRRSIEGTWINNRDQFLYPNDGWKKDKEFLSNCLTYMLFHESNTVQSGLGINHWIPFAEKEVDAKDRFTSHFMIDFIKGKSCNVGQSQQNKQQELFSIETESLVPTEPLEFSPEAQAVFDAGRELWRYYHSQLNVNVNGSLYDIREFFKGRDDKGKINNTCDDEVFNELYSKLSSSLDVLAPKIERKVFDYGFLK